MAVKNKTLIIAEAGVNHNGSIDKALEMVDVAAFAGADFIKFQSFRADHLVTKTAQKAEYQLKKTETTETQFDMLKALELSGDMHKKLISYCQLKEIGFMSTPFDHFGVRFLSKDLNLPVLKVSSGDLTNPLVLLEAANSEKEIVLSTGMGDFRDIENALSLLAYGYKTNKTPLSLDQINAAWSDEVLRDKVRDKVTVLHCTTEYPTPFEDVNLSAMLSIKEKFSVKVGYSDHTRGITVPIAAVAMGAQVIEKHFTLDRTLPGPDHAASLEPTELKEMIKQIRLIEKAIGDGNKKPAKSEIKNVSIARKSLVAAKPINKGELFSLENLTAKRPGDGLSPLQLFSLLGTNSHRNYEIDEKIEQVIQ